MYRSFGIHNFRCFGDLILADLGRVNLIAGVNNVGKTALLEALFLHCGAYKPELSLTLDAFRGVATQRVDLTSWGNTPWDSLFLDFDISKVVELWGDDTVSGVRTVRLRALRKPEDLAGVRMAVEHDSAISNNQREGTLETAQVLELEYKQADKRGKYHLIVDRRGVRTEPIPPAPPFPAVFLAAQSKVSAMEDAERFAILQKLRKQEALVKHLRILEPRLVDFDVIVERGQPTIHGDVGLIRPVPLPYMGDGMGRVASLVLAAGYAQKGVVLLDEIENGLHHSILSKIWKAIAEVAREFDTQIFATTHSLECITAAHAAFSESPEYDFRLHRLDRTDDGIRAVSYDQASLEGAIEMGLEVR